MSERKERALRMINVGRRRANCVCPFCEMDKKAGVFAVWMTNDNRLVCYYGVCWECAKPITKLPQRLLTKMADRANDWLVARFPELLKRLPANYGLESGDNS